MQQVRSLFAGFDPWLFTSVILLTAMGLVTMFTFQGDNFYFERQSIWIGLAIVALFFALIPDYRFLRSGNTTFILYVFIILSLISVLFIGEIVMGAQSRFDFGFFALQPSEPAKIVLIAVLAKYFSKRHVLIGNFRHILISGLYALIIFGLLFVQPDFGSALIIFLVWFGMVLVAGIRPQHLATVLIGGAMIFAALWYAPIHHAFNTETPLLQEYQKERILTFLHPLADIQGAGYNAYQSTIAVGSGQWLGKGVGYGTQSKLNFLPEYETDFIFAAFAEEWGIIGVTALFALFSFLIWRLLYYAAMGATNFERLFTTGVAILFVSHFFIHIGMNIGLLPVTGTTVPLLSYGGTHLITEFIAIGMVMAMTRYTKSHYQTDEIILHTGS